MTDYKSMQWGGSGMTYEMWKWIRDNIETGSTIVEFGAGAISTPRLAPFYNITSYEQSESWARNVQANPEITKSQYDVNVLHAPMVDMFYDRQIIKANLPPDHDLVILDGPSYSATSSRKPFIDLYATGIFNQDAPIVVDDLHRQHDLDIAEALAKRFNLTLKVQGPSNHLFGVLTK